MTTRSTPPVTRQRQQQQYPDQYDEEYDDLMDSGGSFVEKSTRNSTYTRVYTSKNSKDWIQENKNVKVKKWTRQIGFIGNYKAQRWIQGSTDVDDIQENNDDEDANVGENDEEEGQDSGDSDRNGGIGENIKEEENILKNSEEMQL